MDGYPGTALLSGESEALHVRAASVLEKCGFFVFASRTASEAMAIAGVLHSLDLLVLAPSPYQAGPLELLSLCDAWPSLRVIILLPASVPSFHAGSDLATLAREFRDDELRALVVQLLANGGDPTRICRAS